jgi:phosphate transport system permease protein
MSDMPPPSSSTDAIAATLPRRRTTAPARAVSPEGTARRRLLADRAAGWAVTGGGMAIIASILGIFVFILAEVWPLLRGARVEPGAIVSLPGPTMRALTGDEHRTHLVGLGLDGVLRTLRLADGRVLAEQPLFTGPGIQPDLVDAVTPPGGRILAASTSDGRVLVVPVDWHVTFEADTRVVHPAVGTPVQLAIDPGGRPLRAFAAQSDGEGTTTVVGQLASGALTLVRHETRTNAFTGAVTEAVSRTEGTLQVPLTHLLLDSAQRYVYGATAGGALLWWEIRGGDLGEPQVVSADPSRVTALSLLVGERALVVGQENGAVSVWFPVRREPGGFQLSRIRNFEPHPAPVRLIKPSMRDRSFVTVDAAGGLRLQHSTSHQTLWAGTAPLADATALFYAPKADGAYLAARGAVAALDIFNAHPETTLRTLFGKVWYEGYGEPAHVWQSSGSSDDFEPKLGLTPLLVGTLKGTVYSLALAIPLAVLGAMYASQFMHPRYRNVVKPTVEIMAALPSVVLGFLAGLWLAPRLERMFPALVLMAALLPTLILATGALWERLPRRLRGRFATGSETVLFVAVLGAGMWLCTALNAPFSEWAFGGDFQGWLLAHTGLTYDQRNAVVVGLAMGFAVIPIIFSISEDAFSSVPLPLISGSLALGATRWQTVSRVVLPTASPGIFSAVMIGFGRAIGETMIVLMATGNTPILDWSPFNGFRTLSANIAVEIPEAPQFGTLYRVLFLAALLLFAFTFVLNTVAELVRQRLRARYGQL